jgi:hypothetical protein
MQDMNSGMTRVYTVSVRPADINGSGEGMGEAGALRWTARIAELPDCVATGSSFDELEQLIRARVLEQVGGRRNDGTLSRDDTDVELQWSVDETDSIGDADIQAAHWLEE